MAGVRGIVLPLDGSELSLRAVPVVRRLSARTGAPVTLVTSTFGGGGATSEEFDVAESTFEGAVVDRVAMDDRGPACAAVDATRVAEGRILCMSTHGRGGIRRSVLGSVTSEVIRSGDVEVLLVGPRCDPEGALGRAGPIMVCVDGSDRSEAAVAAGAAWAEILERDVALRLVVPPFDAIAPSAIDAVFDRLRPALDATGRGVTAGPLVRASVPEALVDFAETEECSLMVICADARARWKRLLLGGVTLAVLGQAPCPVLVVPSPHR